MKYLKTYKIFESNEDDYVYDIRDILLDLEDTYIYPEPDETKEIIKDICLELNHEGFRTIISFDKGGSMFVIIEKVTYPKEGMIRFFSFDYSEVEEVVERIKEVLGNKYESTSSKSKIVLRN